MKRGRDYELFTATGDLWDEGRHTSPPHACWFLWRSRDHCWLFDQGPFPIAITRRSLARPAKQSDHWRRVWLTLRGKWKPEYEIGDKSPNKPVFEITHALWNVVVETSRAAGIWNRKDKSPWEPAGYDWSA